MLLDGGPVLDAGWVTGDFPEGPDNFLRKPIAFPFPRGS